MTLTYNRNDVLGLEYRNLTGEEISRIGALKELGQELILLMAATGQSREMDVALTRLEEAVIWSVKHVAQHGICAAEDRRA